MGHVKIQIIEKGTEKDLQRWKEHMLEVPKCWNKFCFDCYDEECVDAFFVKIEGSETIYVTTLCRDCIEKESIYGILIHSKHLMVVRYPISFISKSIV